MYRRVPNALTYTSSFLGLVIAFLEGGFSGAGWAMVGLLVGGGVVMPAAAYGFVGQGDMKLMAAAGSLLGPVGAVNAVLFGAVLGGIWALGWLVAKGDRKSTLPYAPPLGIGILLAFFF